MIDGKEWKEKGGASVNDGKLTLYSSDDHLEGVYIMVLNPAMKGTFELNRGAQAQYTDSLGKNFTTKEGSGVLEITKYLAPEGESKGSVEGTFYGVFAADASSDRTIKNCSFLLPVKNL